MAPRKATSRRSHARRREPEQLTLFRQRGGKRRGAGRPPKGARAGSPHKKRPDLHARHPVHVVLRTVSVGPPIYEPLLVYRPRTWLLREGWKKHSATISCREVPSMKQ